MTKIEQSFKNFSKALRSLEEAVSTPPIENRDFAGIIQNFEFTYELCWKTLKLILESNGIEAPFPRVVFEESFKRGMIFGNSEWKEIMEARNLSSHTYNESLAKKLVPIIKDQHLPVFQQTEVKMRGFI